MQRYRVGYLANYGYFANNASLPIDEHVVTFAQANYSAAKMARPADSDLTAAYSVCRGYATVQADRSLRSVRSVTHQYLRDLVSYVDNYARMRHSLRVEEVITLDRLRYRGTLSDMIARLNLFSEDGTMTDMCIVTM
ncbi:hypothetical protein X777_11332 [Ooceraea biroi]|uniref:Uncharacterized protein n=1 Tax=Ooceraea biroi TaxID=2015173 RepID=A0A026W2G6_OOCBI|nr:hypothetical protein X777_11332 [Ooceraea biroi]